jgi:hypothetical protein
MTTLKKGTAPSTRKAAIPPTEAQIGQLISNFERIRDIDLRCFVVGRGNGLGTLSYVG